MHWKELRMDSVLFTHFEEETGKQTDICISELEKEAKEIEVVEVPILPDHAVLIAKLRGIEPHRLSRLLRATDQRHSIQATPDFEPILMVEWGDGSWLNVDGSHRYLAGFLLGFQFIKAKMITEGKWKKFIVEGLPKEQPERLLKSYSGLK